MATSKQKQSLKRKLNYLNSKYGYSFDVANVDKNYKALLKQQIQTKKKHAIDRKVNSVNRLIATYNEVASPIETHNNRKINVKVTEDNFKTAKRAKQVKKLRQEVNKAIRTQGREEKTPKRVKKAVVNMLKGQGIVLKSSDFLRKTVGKLTRDVDDYLRIERGLLPFQEQVYYDNFLKAAYRATAKELFISARDKGFSWVNNLLNSGFSITEIYAFMDDTDDVIEPTYLTDVELEASGYNSLYPEQSNTDLLKATKWGRHITKQAKLFLRAFK